MSYFLSLDEYREEQLIEELTRRKKMREAGLCDYCSRIGSTTPCKFPERHKMVLSLLQESVTPPAIDPLAPPRRPNKPAGFT